MSTVKNKEYYKKMFEKIKDEAYYKKETIKHNLNLLINSDFFNYFEKSVKDNKKKSFEELKSIDNIDFLFALFFIESKRNKRDLGSNYNDIYLMLNDDFEDMKNNKFMYYSYGYMHFMNNTYINNNLKEIMLKIMFKSIENAIKIINEKCNINYQLSTDRAIRLLNLIDYLNIRDNQDLNTDELKIFYNTYLKSSFKIEEIEFKIKYINY